MQIKLFPEDYYISGCILIKIVTTYMPSGKKKKELNSAFKNIYMAVNVE